MQPKQSINDFVIKFANVNGTGSASANGMFAKAIFRMGIPVSPRNIFPSIFSYLLGTRCALVVTATWGVGTDMTVSVNRRVS